MEYQTPNQITVLKVDGICCEVLRKKVQKKLAKLPGVESVGLDREGNHVVRGKIDHRQVQDALAGLGKKADVVYFGDQPWNFKQHGSEHHQSSRPEHNEHFSHDARNSTHGAEHKSFSSHRRERNKNKQPEHGGYIHVGTRSTEHQGSTCKNGHHYYAQDHESASPCENGKFAHPHGGRNTNHHAGTSRNTHHYHSQNHESTSFREPRNFTHPQGGPRSAEDEAETYKNTHHYYSQDHEGTSSDKLENFVRPCGGAKSAEHQAGKSRNSWCYHGHDHEGTNSDKPKKFVRPRGGARSAEHQAGKSRKSQRHHSQDDEGTSSQPVQHAQPEVDECTCRDDYCQIHKKNNPHDDDATNMDGKSQDEPVQGKSKSHHFGGGHGHFEHGSFQRPVPLYQHPPRWPMGLPPSRYTYPLQPAPQPLQLPRWSREELPTRYTYSQQPRSLPQPPQAAPHSLQLGVPVPKYNSFPDLFNDDVPGCTGM